MTFISKAQAAIDAVPPPINITVMLGSLVLSILQPIAVLVTIIWGCLQIHGYVEKRWGWQWLARIVGKDK